MAGPRLVKGEDGAALGESSASPESSTGSPSATAGSDLRVLVAKTLTNSDAGSGRIILPRVAVESRLSFVVPYRHFALRVRCTRTGAAHRFVVKSWANGSEHRRVFVLEAAGEYLRAQGLGVGDTVGICAAADGSLLVAANTPELLAAVACPRGAGGQGAAGSAAAAAAAAATGAAYGSTSRALVGSLPGEAAGPGMGLVRCTRSGHCTKPAGHPGFCSGPKGSGVTRGGAAAAITDAAADGSAVTSPMASFGGRDRRAPTSAGGSEEEAFARWRGAGAFAARRSSRARRGTKATHGATVQRVPESPRPAFVPSTVAEDLALPGAPAALRAAAGAAPRTGVLTLAPRARLCKALTAYDIKSGRIVLPATRVAGAAPCAMRLSVGGGAVHGAATAATASTGLVPAVDESGVWCTPTLRAWASVAGRRGFVLEGAAVAQFLEARGAAPGDVLRLARCGRGGPPRLHLLRLLGGSESHVEVENAPATSEDDGNNDEGAASDDEEPAAPRPALVLHPNTGATTVEDGAADDSHSTLRWVDWPALLLPERELDGSSAAEEGAGRGRHVYGSCSDDSAVEDDDDEGAGGSENDDEDAEYGRMDDDASGRAGGRGAMHRGGPVAPAIAGAACGRTPGCIKAAGHQGFCSGHKGFRRRADGSERSAGGTRRSRAAGAPGPRGAGQMPYRPEVGYTAVVLAGDRHPKDEDDDSDYVPTAKRARGMATGAARRGPAPIEHTDPLLSLLSLLD